MGELLMDKSWAEFYLSNLNHYRRLEEWGAGLFTTAIALTTHALAFEADPSKPRFGNLDENAMYAPAAMSVFAFGFLLTVNWRGRLSRVRYGWARMTKEGQEGQIAPDDLPIRHRRLLGWLIASLPVLLGFASSWALGGSMFVLGVLLIFTIALGFAALFWDRKKANSADA